MKEQTQAERLHEIIDAERNRLGQVVMLLRCISLALQHDGDKSLAGPYYPLAVDAVVSMVAEAVDAFDPSHLPDEDGRSED